MAVERIISYEDSEGVKVEVYRHKSNRTVTIAAGKGGVVTGFVQLDEVGAEVIASGLMRAFPVVPLTSRP